MKNLKVLLLVAVMAVMMSTAVMAAPEDYEMVIWESIEYVDYDGNNQAVYIELSGVVGQPTDEAGLVTTPDMDIIVLATGGMYFTENEDGTFTADYSEMDAIVAGERYTKEALIAALPQLDVSFIPVVDGAEMTIDSIIDPEHQEFFFPGGYAFIDEAQTMMMPVYEQLGGYDTEYINTFYLGADMDFNSVAYDFVFPTITSESGEQTIAILPVSEEVAAELLANMDAEEMMEEAVEEPVVEETATEEEPAMETDENADEAMPAVSYTAAPTNTNFLVNGEPVAFNAYIIEDNNYMKLRDIAMAVNGTEKQFDTLWDGEAMAINMVSRTAYQPVGGELAAGDGMAKDATVTTATIMKDGVVIEMKAYNIDGNNYFKVRDVAKAFDIGVTWDNETKTAGLDTSISYEE